MALSLREKSTISRRIKDNVASLVSGSLSLRDKSKVSREIKTDVALLVGGTVSTPEPELTIFQQIAKGVHDALGAVEVFNKIKSEVDSLTREIISGDTTIDKALLDACIKCADLAEKEGIA